MLRRAFPVVIAFFLGLLPVMPEAMAFAHGGQDYVPMSRADRMSRGACERPAVPSAAVPSHLSADTPTRSVHLLIPAATDADGSCPDSQIAYQTTLSPANRIRAP